VMLFEGILFVVFVTLYLLLDVFHCSNWVVAVSY
jgi:hypothetical protein